MNLHHIIERIRHLIIEYLAEESAGSVVEYHSPQDLERLYPITLDAEGCTEEEFLIAVEDYLKYSVRTGHNMFFNQLFGGFELPAFIGEIITALTNTSMYTYEVSPLATLMEKELILQMNQLIGFQDGGGIFCSGGSNGNLLGLMCARNKYFKDCQMNGFPKAAIPVLFISDQAHYSFLKAANVLGIGQNNVIKVKSDQAGKMIPSELEKAVIEAKEEGKTPFFVAATCGTTVRGAFDPVHQIANLAKKHDLWFHVDAAWGGPMLLSSKHRSLLKGSHRADSLSWDAHKLMGVPLICTAFLTQHKNILHQTNSLERIDTDYLLHEDDHQYNFGYQSLQCGRRVDSLKLWLLWKVLGTKGFERRFDHLFKVRNYVKTLIAHQPCLELVEPIEFLNICFRYIPDNHPDFNQFNQELREYLKKEGKILVNYSHINGITYIRLILTNPYLTKEDMDYFVQTLMTAGKKMDFK
ncbi:MAG: pyridoxal-dependent decarboxylase [Spirochaetes bacterium]|nr:pyridoxal-dependent decarboxylase [Spirochaetota bacterium]